MDGMTGGVRWPDIGWSKVGCHRENDSGCVGECRVSDGD